jgi:predicted HicB family RNase H-like nuclease
MLEQLCVLTGQSCMGGFHEPNASDQGSDGSIEYSAEDRVLYGSLTGIRDAIVYEEVDVDSLESNFRAAVDEDLAFCAAEGKMANRPFQEGST